MKDIAIVTRELDSFRAEMLEVLKTSMEAVVGSADKRKRCSEPTEGLYDATGVRQGIIANARLLVSLMMPHETTGVAVISCFEIDAELRVVTSGSEPAIIAHIYTGPASKPQELCAATPAPDTTSALMNLLNLTQELIHTKLGLPNRPSAPVKTLHRAKHTRMSTLDEHLWGSETYVNTSFHEGGAFNYNQLDWYAGGDEGSESPDSTYGSESEWSVRVPHRGNTNSVNHNNVIFGHDDNGVETVAFTSRYGDS